MRATRIGRSLRFAGPALLAAASVAAASGSVVVPARAGEGPCDGTGAYGDEVPCTETVPPPPTVTETGPLEEPPTDTGTVPTETETVPTETETVPTETETVVPPPAPAPTKRPKRTTTAKPRPAPSSVSSSSSGILGSGTRIGLLPHSGTPTLSGGPYVFPVIGPTSFDDTWGAPRATVAWHHGVDIFAPLGSPIVAVADGTLFSVGSNTLGGQRLWLRDREGNYFYYAHLSAFSRIAVEGARVRAGTVIGYVGNTGDAVGTPYHLHFEIHPVSLLSMGYDGAVNPFPYVSSWQRLDPTGAEAASTSAPAPGAILLAFTDISSASGLSPASLERTLEKDAVLGAPVYELESLEVTPSKQATIPPPRSDDALIARALDSEATRPARYAASVWDRLAVCESGGDWRANTGNGYVGGLQFLPQTWDSHGGSTFAPSPDLATREQQIAVAERVLESQGWRAWPFCSAMLGLRALGNE